MILFFFFFKLSQTLSLVLSSSRTPLLVSPFVFHSVFSLKFDVYECFAFSHVCTPVNHVEAGTYWFLPQEQQVLLTSVNSLQPLLSSVF